MKKKHFLSNKFLRIPLAREKNKADDSKRRREKLSHKGHQKSHFEYQNVFALATAAHFLLPLLLSSLMNVIHIVFCVIAED
jgi:hypothetical protein